MVQGLKSLASKLHPQLPLSPKESQRLLTALTSSFRQHLDRAYPQQLATQESRPRLEDGVTSKIGTQHLHGSSVDLADRHLASVLTNPLLTKPDGMQKPKLDYATAKIELYRNPGKDPISLLEEYHEKGAATIAIAVLCLETSKQSLNNMPSDKRHKAVVETLAGKRTLLWLWNSKLHDTDAFVDDPRLSELMVPAVIEEGFEEILWEWLQMDIKLGSQNRPKPAVDVPYRDRTDHYGYRWKGRLLHSIITAHLARGPNYSANSALDAYFRACDIRQSGPQRNNGSTTIPLAQANIALFRAFVYLGSKSGKSWQQRLLNTDVARYDRFIDSLVLSTGGFNSTWRRAMLWLDHPTRPNAVPMLEVFEKMFVPNPPQSVQSVLKYFEAPKEEKREFIYKSMVDTAARLQERGLTTKADWVNSHTLRLFPDFARHHEKNWGQAKQRVLKSKVQSSETGSAAPEPVPFPSFC